MRTAQIAAGSRRTVGERVEDAEHRSFRLAYRTGWAYLRAPLNGRLRWGVAGFLAGSAIGLPTLLVACSTLNKNTMRYRGFHLSLLYNKKKRSKTFSQMDQDELERFHSGLDRNFIDWMKFCDSPHWKSRTGIVDIGRKAAGLMLHDAMSTTDCIITLLLDTSNNLPEATAIVTAAKAIYVPAFRSAIDR